MPRPPRIDKAGFVYHVLNRSNGRQQIFQTEKDYLSFEKILTQAQERTNMRIYSYIVMPNHWHLAVSPKNDGDLAEFARWLTLTHTQRYHAFRKTIGGGHLYQGRFKSFLVSTDEYFLTLCRYIERNALRAKLSPQAEGWRWSSLWRRTYGTDREKRLLARWPVNIPSYYTEWINEQEKQETLDRIRDTIRRGNPFGKEEWVQNMAKKFGLDSTLKPRGRPRKGT
jgi:putative transposase